MKIKDCIARGIPEGFDSKNECVLFLQGLKALFEAEYGDCVKVYLYVRDSVVELCIDSTLLLVEVRYRRMRFKGSGSNTGWRLSNLDEYGYFETNMRFKSKSVKDT